MALHPEYLAAYHEVAQDMLPASLHARIHDTAKAKSGGRVSGKVRGVLGLGGNPADDLAAISMGEADSFEIRGEVLTCAVVRAEGTDRHYVWSTVYTPHLEDSHGDWAAPEDVERAAHSFMRDHVAAGAQTASRDHAWETAPGISVVESYVAPQRLEINGKPVLKGAWVICHELDTSVPQAAEIWDGVERGELLSVSLEGSAVKEQVPCPAP